MQYEENLNHNKCVEQKTFLLCSHDSRPFPNVLGGTYPLSPPHKYFQGYCRQNSLEQYVHCFQLPRLTLGFMRSVCQNLKQYKIYYANEMNKEVNCLFLPCALGKLWYWENYWGRLPEVCWWSGLCNTNTNKRFLDSRMPVAWFLQWGYFMVLPSL